LSYGTIEIETDMAKADFDNIIDGKNLPKNMDRQTFLKGFNAFITHKQLWQKIVEHGEPMPITVERDTDISSIGKASKHAYCLGRSASEKKRRPRC